MTNVSPFLSTVDLDAQHHLCMGKGVDPEGEPPTFVEQHVRSFHKLRKTHKRWGIKTKPCKITVDRGVGMTLVRYHAACKGFLQNCFCINVACDVSRIGGKDVLLVSLLATDTCGEARVCWAPPQVWVHIAFVLVAHAISFLDEALFWDVA